MRAGRDISRPGFFANSLDILPKTILLLTFKVEVMIFMKKNHPKKRYEKPKILGYKEGKLVELSGHGLNIPWEQGFGRIHQPL
jgi:hypothetical protein